jgi:hypothetical protein
MKMSSGFIRLTFGDRSLSLPNIIVTALSFEPQTELYITAAVPTSGASQDPDLTLIASALPDNAWGRLLRGSFSVDRGSGSFHRLIDKLEELRLYPRTFSVEEAAPGVLATSGDSGPIPTVLMTFEIQAPEASINGNNRNLLLTLEAAAKARVDNHRAVDELSKALDGRTRAEGMVNWLSSMRVLNSLAESRSRGQIYRVPLQGSDDNLSLSIENWRTRIWPSSREKPYESTPDEQLAFCIAIADEDEQTLHVHFFCPSGGDKKKQGRILVEFTLLVPSGGVESLWFHWASDQIRQHFGSIIYARTGARVERRWLRIQVAAVFPDGGACAQALKGLQGRRLSQIDRPTGFEASVCKRLDSPDKRGDKDKRLPHREDVIRDCLPDPDKMKSVLATKAQEFSTLTNVRLFGGNRSDRRESTNPYVFTRPYDENHSDVRKRICDRIAGLLLQERPEHVLIVGGHRTGKTSFRNLLEKKLKDGTADEQVAVIRLNMATTPPSQVFVTLVEYLPEGRMERVKNRLAQEFKRLIEGGLAVGTSVVRLVALLAFFSRVSSLKLSDLNQLDIRPYLSGATPADSSKSSALSRSDQWLREVLSSWNPNTDENKALMLRESASLLAYALDDDSPTKVVIVVDEFGDAGYWDGRWAYPALRALIEGQLNARDHGVTRSLGVLRWVFLSSRPLDEIADYSPLGNAVREYNLPPLSDKEAGCVLQKFYETPPTGQTVPVLIWDARTYLLQESAHHPYLLQVVAHHAWEAALRQPTPVVTLELVKTVIQKKVLSEVGDFFARECSHLDSACRAALRALADGIPGASLEPHQRKAIERAGLHGTNEGKVVPLLLTWIRSGGLAVE